MRHDEVTFTSHVTPPTYYPPVVTTIEYVYDEWVYLVFRCDGNGKELMGVYSDEKAAEAATKLWQRGLRAVWSYVVESWPLLRR